MFDKFLSASTGLMRYTGKALKRHPKDYCDLETVDSDFVLVARSGALASVLNVTGVKRLMDSNSLYSHVVASLEEALHSSLEGRAHAIQMVFENDPDRTVHELEQVQKPSRDTCRRLGMDLQSLLDARTDALKDWVSAERVWLVVWTLPSALSKAEAKRENKKRMAATSGTVLSVMGQNPMAACDAIRDRHDAMVSTIESELNASDVCVDLLTARRALREIRASLDPAFTGPDWNPCLPGDRVLPSERQEGTGPQIWDTVWPTLGSQLCSRDADIIGPNRVALGDRIYEPMYMDIFPQAPDFFHGLFARVNEKGIPWRVSFLITGGGLSSFGFKAGIAQIIAFASNDNKLVARAKKELQAMQDEGYRIVQARIAACTWAPKNDPDLLSSRASGLSTALSAWGSGQVSEVTGDPLAGLMSTVPAFTQGSIATKVAAPLNEILAMMPWGRPASPWEKGAVTFRSPDGKLMPYQPYSDKQSTWISLIFARPGSGKSVLMNMNNLALTMAPGATRLPRIAIIDIGPSSGGFISMVRESLSPAQQHLVTHRRLRMVPSDAINVFDTQLGCRYPVPSELAFLRNLVTLITTDFNTDKPYSGASQLVTAVIDEMYKMRSDKEDPTRYAPGLVREVDEAIRRHGIKVDGRTSWWEVVDALISADEIRPATLAQRHAVPLLPDSVQAAQSERVRNVFEKIVIDTGESLVDAFCRMVGDALNMYPILARPTAFDVSDSRIVALDLDEVTKSGGAIADRQTAVMYMIARQVLARDYYLSKEIVKGMPAPPEIHVEENCPVAKIREIHMERIKEIREDPKRICYDEFHRTSSSSQVRQQVLLDMREGRKWNVDIMLASQSLQDFDDLMIEQATGIFVMDGGNAATIDDIAKRFGFADEAERHALERRVHPPRAGGGTFLAKFMTTDGWFTTLLSLTMGAMELWGLNTSATDAAVRDRLYERIGPVRARKVLAYAYPKGSARSDIQERKQRMGDDVEDDAGTASAVEQVVKDLLDLETRLSARK